MIGTILDGVHELFAALASDQKQRDNRIPANIGEPLHGAHRATLNQHAGRLKAARLFQVVRYLKRSLARLREGLAAGQTAETLQTIPMLSKPLNCVATIRTIG